MPTATAASSLRVRAAELEAHDRIKDIVNLVISNLSEKESLGVSYPVNVRLMNEVVGFNIVPDGLFVSWDAFASNRVKVVNRKRRAGQDAQLAGAPDWVLEVVSEASVEKDVRLLRSLYCQAGVPEYWLIDARAEEIDFRLLVRGRNRYRAVKPREGWHASPIFRREFRLERRRDRMGLWRYTLHHRPV